MIASQFRCCISALSNVMHIRPAKLCLWMSLAAQIVVTVPALSSSVPIIISECSEPQMFWPHTAFEIASVQYAHAFWNRATINDPANPVRKHSLGLKPHLAIAVYSGRFPFPTISKLWAMWLDWSIFIDLSPKEQFACRNFIYGCNNLLRHFSAFPCKVDCVQASEVAITTRSPSFYPLSQRLAMLN